MEILGIDVGGSGIKAAVVDTGAGVLVGERVRVETPAPATPASVVSAAAELVADLAPGAPAGIGMPSVVVQGVTETAANIDAGWIGAPAHDLFSRALGRECVLVNDADAAGIAEMRFGAGRGRTGTVLVLTLGTGIGSALFIDGALVPNTELGHLELDGHKAESRASAAAREREDLSWKKWTSRLDRYLGHVEAILRPELIILGGGVSRKAARWLPHLTLRHAEIVPAALENQAGIVGAATLAAALVGHERP